MHPENNLQSPLLCVIPARGGSKRLPRKNIANLDGKPMLAYTIEAARKSGLFERVNVSTEDPEIAEIAQQYGACVPYTRPADLATDQATVAQVCCHMLDFFASQGQVYETVCILLPSAPLRIAQDITGTYQRFRESGADYAMAVTSYIYPPWQALIERNGLLQPYWGEEAADKKSQEVPPLWVDTGAVYIARVAAYRYDQHFYTGNLVGYPIPPERALDIDNAFQLYLARLLLADQSGQAGFCQGRHAVSGTEGRTGCNAV